jgi:hypothetical protein
MAWHATFEAQDRRPIAVCVEGARVPRSLDIITYTNPRTGRKEVVSGIGGWGGSADTPCGSGFAHDVIGTIHDPSAAP